MSPKMLLIACCDSRVDPAIISDCDPGDLFVVRNVANLVAPYTPDDNHHGVSAALEYAVKTLAVSSIVIMGHTRCGGIEALMNGIVESKVTEFIGPWMRVAMKAKERVVRHFSDHPPAFQLRACEHASILLSLENLVTYPWIRDRVAAGSLSIHGWYFDFEEGEMLAWNADTHVFEPLVNRRDSVPGLGVGGDEGVE
ncbi:putative carbonic anhydrase [Zopfochytrium polystomum]|nr:putative carbonic anhydrase [Zopfochytrium polystomum]